MVCYSTFKLINNGFVKQEENVQMTVSLILKCHLKFAAADMSNFVATLTNQLGLTYHVNHLLADNLHDIALVSSKIR